jgi:pyridoxamine 5'-phosphate oxidase
MNLNDWRNEYPGDPNEQIQLHPDPLIQFEEWLQEAKDKSIMDPNAMVLSTCLNNHPSSRVVLLKMVLNGRFIFFTHYDSRKGQEIEDNPRGTLLFYWNTLARQVRIEGIIRKTDPDLSDRYFAERPRESQINAWASRQSRTVSGNELLKAIEKYRKQFEGQPVPRPPGWGGFELEPELFEFWFGGKNRNHQRTLYRKKEAHWITEFLYP